MAQLRDFVGKLGGLQSEHQSLRLRKYRVTAENVRCDVESGLDTGLSEMLVPMTRTEEFNKSLEIQQSKPPPRAQPLPC